MRAEVIAVPCTLSFALPQAAEDRIRAAKRESYMQAVENVPVCDVYADGISEVEILGVNARLTFYTIERGKRVVVAKIIRPLMSICGAEVCRMIEAARDENGTLLH